MDSLTVDELRQLMAQATPPCISIYLPTRRGGAPEDKKRFAGLAKQARDQAAMHLTGRALAALADPLDEFMHSPVWSHALEGLAVFRSTDTLVQYRLPAAVPELAIVADSFHIRPLLAFLQTNRSYYLLNLSQNHVAFYKGSANGLVSVDLPALPRSLSEALGALGIEERERSVTYHHSARGGQNPIHGGVSKSDTSRDEDLARFFRAVDQALWEELRDGKVPLVLAAAERSNAMYRTISRYPHLAAEGLIGNFARASGAELHERAWAIVQKEAASCEADVLDRYQHLKSRERALDEVRAIAKFAVQGRVRELLLAMGSYMWGTLNRSTGCLAFDGDAHEPLDSDVLDNIAESVLLRGGEVYTLARDRMPSSSSIAATLRW